MKRACAASVCFVDSMPSIGRLRQHCANWDDNVLRHVRANAQEIKNVNYFVILNQRLE
jgi:hypothetical protein